MQLQPTFEYKTAIRQYSNVAVQHIQGLLNSLDLRARMTGQGRTIFDFSHLRELAPEINHKHAVVIGSK